MEQRTRLKFGASGNRFSTLTGKRTLESSCCCSGCPARRPWIAMRDVIAVDGVRRSDGERRARAASTARRCRSINCGSSPTKTAATTSDRSSAPSTSRRSRSCFLDEHYRHRFCFSARERGHDRSAPRRDLRILPSGRTRPSSGSRPGRGRPRHAVDRQRDRSRCCRRRWAVRRRGGAQGPGDRSLRRSPRSSMCWCRSKCGRAIRRRPAKRSRRWRPTPISASSKRPGRLIVPK